MKKVLYLIFMAAVLSILNSCRLGLGESVGSPCPVCHVVYYSSEDLLACIASHNKITEQEEKIEEQQEEIVKKDETKTK